nr:MAG TPA: hypothetical protein [Caudoviricetes sp.]
MKIKEKKRKIKYLKSVFYQLMNMVKYRVMLCFCLLLVYDIINLQ